MNRDDRQDLTQGVGIFFTGASLVGLAVIASIAFSVVGERVPTMSNAEVAQAAESCERMGLAVHFETTPYGRPVSFNCTSEAKP